jgi:hypothetical protein
VEPLAARVAMAISRMFVLIVLTAVAAFCMLVDMSRVTAFCSSTAAAICDEMLSVVRLYYQAPWS